MEHRRLIPRIGPWLAMATLLLTGTGAASSTYPTNLANPTNPTKTLYVANNGLDSALCGAKLSPCRSIRQAMANASAGSLIVVGPGRYGDLNQNGMFGEFGEEGAPAGCNCMVQVDKPIRLVSRDGPAATVLDATGAPAVTVVRITANDVVFGGPLQGFTLRGGTNSLVVQGTTRVVVQGNLAMASNRDGFLILGDGNSVQGNQSVGNVQAGFVVAASANSVLDNQAISNGGPGYWIDNQSHVVRRNRAIDNGGEGFRVSGQDHTFRQNVAVGNRGFGIVAMNPGLIFRLNDIYGNYSILNPDLANCGLVNDSAGTITATDNFWGAPSGPGPDPADEACETGGGQTIVQPFARQEFGLSTSVLPAALPDDAPDEDSPTTPTK